MDDIKKSIYSSRVLAAVSKLSADRAPEVALRKDVIREVGLKESELDEILEDLHGRGFVETGRAINDTYIKIMQS